MRAAAIEQFGGPEFLQVMKFPKPTTEPRELLIKVAYAGVNPLDYKVRDGSSKLAKLMTPIDFPLILGEEFSGWVEKVSGGLHGFEAGDAVFGMVPMTHGCYAEYVNVPYDSVAHAPDGAPMEKLGGLSLAGLTAWVAVHELGRVTASDVVLVHGGGGGVGQLMVQLAVATGATVYATASEKHREKVTGWGARFVDYKSEDFTVAVPKPDVIIDAVYFGTYERSIGMLSKGDRLVVLPTLADLEPARAAGLDVAIPSLTPSPERLESLARKVADGTLDLVVSKVLPLADAAAAHREVESGHAEGKIVLKVAD